MERKRRIEISVLNVLFSLIVIFIHVNSYSVSAFEVNTPKYTVFMLMWRLASFVVPGFVLLSGVKLFLNGKDKLPMGTYIKGRLKGVILPYVICFGVFYVFYMVVYDYPLDPWFMLKHLVFGGLVCHMYFIPLLFQFDLLFPLWKKVINKCSPLIVIPFAILISQLLKGYFPGMLKTIFPQWEFLYNDRLFTTYLSYWLVGCYVGKNYDAFCEIMKRNFRVICTFFGIALVGVIYFSYLAFNQIEYIPYINEVHNLYVLAVCIFLYALVLKIPDSVILRIPFLLKLDGASFYIYLYHMLAVLLGEWLVQRLGIVAQGPAFLLRAVVAYGLTLPCCVIYKSLKKKVMSNIVRRKKCSGL
ncbi:MAG: acyltransferase [Ruminococcaceae bacterium]|nr:acyltransferase [Oscillospiraceae bacterium]